MESKMSRVASSEGENRIILESWFAFDLDHGTPFYGLELADEHGWTLSLVKELKSRTEVGNLDNVSSA